jgi:hypothetical protein
LNHPAGTQDQDERAAVGVENDLRLAQGLVPRDPNHWPQSNCGCPNGCCIVASVATDSPYSAEVHALRSVRDYVLRGTQFGYHLFDVLHEEYYTFSVPICRVMVVDRAAQANVERWLVRPLVRVFQIAQEYSRKPNDFENLGEYIRQDQEQGFITDADTALAWDMISTFLQEAAEGRNLPAVISELDDATKQIYGILAEWLPHCPHIRWGIIDLLAIYASARARYLSLGDQRATGQWLKQAFDEWVGNIPLHYIRARMSPSELGAEVSQLANTIFTSQQARQSLGQRIVKEWNIEPDSLTTRQLRDAGYLA